ncbi:hypothetical protein AZZ97_002993 [Klebsiella pneumoniae]|nr:hypothetical protein AZZ97_002993 [Klebsiella pneumoniae]
MKNYLKGVWEYFASHMFFMYLGSVSLHGLISDFLKKLNHQRLLQQFQR